jgi:predicted porin
MKKILGTVVALLLIATATFADVSFQTANSVGLGKWAVLGMYATNHQGNAANLGDGDPAANDATSLGVRGEYGIMKDLDVVAAYSMDTLVNVSHLNAKQQSGSTMALGVKYSLSMLSMPVDSAVVVGYETSGVGLKLDAGGTGSATTTTMALGYVVSKQMGMCVPYGGVFVKSLSQTMSKKLTGGLDFGSIGGTGLAFNLGCAIGIAANQAILVEWNSENQAWAEAKKGAFKIEENTVNVSGISLGYVYMF